MPALAHRESSQHEYEVLSHDRAKAVDIFVKAVILASGFLSVTFALMIAARTRAQVGVASCVGLFLLTFFLTVARRCRRHDEQLHKNLTELGRRLRYHAIIPTRYIFNVVLQFGAIIFVLWLAVAVIKLIDPSAISLDFGFAKP